VHLRSERTDETRKGASTVFTVAALLFFDAILRGAFVARPHVAREEFI
jgi:hypothetical protein